MPIWGETAIPYVLVYDQLGTFLALATYGTFVVCTVLVKLKLHLKLSLLKF